MRKNDAVVTFKTCPKCRGTGQVPCDGKDHFRQRYLYNAWRFHMKPVIYKGKQNVPGIAVAGINPGGWAYLDIYVSIAPDRYGRSGASNYFNEEIGDYLHVRRRKKRGTKMEYQNFYVIECRGPEMDKVELLDIWPQDLMLLPSGYELEGEDVSWLLKEAEEALVR